MAADASIYGLIQQPKQPNPLEMLTQALKVRGLQQEGDLNAMRADEYTRGVARKNKLEALAGSWTKDTTDDQRIGSLKNSGYFDEADKLEQGLLKRQEVKATTQKNGAEALGKFGEAQNNIATQVMANPSPAVANIALDAMAAHAKHLGFDHVLPQIEAERQLVAGMTTPEQIKQWAAGHALKGKELLPKTETRNTGGTTDTLAVDPLTGEVRVTNSVKNTATPGDVLAHEDRVASRSQAERHFNAGQNAPQYMETDAGLVALPKRLTPGQAPVGTPVTGADGQPLGKPLKDIPPAQNAAIIENAKALQNIDDAIASITQATGIAMGADGKPVRVDGAQPTSPNALGARNYLGDGIRQRTDPQGVPVRAKVANIAGQKFHDISGAAVSVGEAQRLKPFIPSDTDTPEVALTKLVNLRREYSGVNDMLGQTYSKTNGYKPSPVKASSGVVDFHKLPTGGNNVVDFGSLQ